MNYSLAGILFLFLTTILMSGCRQLEVVEVSKTGSAFVFTFAEKYQELAFSDIQVKKENCQEGCIYWDVVVKADIDGNPVYTTINNKPIVYGEVPGGMEERVPPKKLIPGQYLAGGTFLQSQKKGKIFFVDFKIIKNESGELILE